MLHHLVKKSNKYSNNTLGLTSLFWADDWQSGGILGALSLLPTRLSNAKSQLGDAFKLQILIMQFSVLTQLERLCKLQGLYLLCS